MFEIDIIKKTVEQIAPNHHVNKVDLFGSYALGNQNEESDIDLLVEFDKNNASLFDLIGLKLDIEDRLNKPVDIVSLPLKEDSLLDIDKVVKIYEA